MRKTTKVAIKLILIDSVKWLLIYGAIGLGIYFAIVLFIVNLVDVKLIVSLLIVEVPLAAVVSTILGESRRNKFQDAVEHLRAVRDFSHLRIHRFGNPMLVSWYYVENTDAKSAYDAPEYFIALATNDVIEVVDHATEEKMHVYFEENGIRFENRHPKPSELT